MKKSGPINQIIMNKGEKIEVLHFYFHHPIHIFECWCSE
jgi:hypothetical protein